MEDALRTWWRRGSGSEAREGLGTLTARTVISDRERSGTDGHREWRRARPSAPSPVRVHASAIMLYTNLVTYKERLGADAAALSSARSKARGCAAPARARGSVLMRANACAQLATAHELKSRAGQK
jgi:hypothetical protein